MPPFTSTFMNSAIFKAMSQRSDFSVARTVSIPATRSDDDWDRRLVAVRTHCAESAIKRWRIRAPMSEPYIHADFEDDKEALFFKLRFG